MKIGDRSFVNTEHIQSNFKKAEIKQQGDQVTLGGNNTDTTILMADQLKAQKAGPEPPIGTVLALIGGGAVAGTAGGAIAGANLFGIWGGIGGGVIGLVAGGALGLGAAQLYCS